MARSERALYHNRKRGKTIVQRWIVLRIDTDEPKVIASYAEEEQADKTCETLMRENKGRVYLVVDGDVVDECGYLY